MGDRTARPSSSLSVCQVAETIDMEGPQQFMEMQRIFEEARTNQAAYQLGISVFFSAPLLLIS